MQDLGTDLKLEHCFGYLREILMCHSDLDIMSMNWEPERQMYTAQFDVIKQCRNIDLIKQWTREHQTGWWPHHEH
jgi:Mycotoxin biosynthesis protein UstYa